MIPWRYFVERIDFISSKYFPTSLSLRFLSKITKEIFLLEIKCDDFLVVPSWFSLLALYGEHDDDNEDDRKREKPILLMSAIPKTKTPRDICLDY